MNKGVKSYNDENWDYTYDVYNRMSDVAKDDANIANYTFNALGNRVMKYVNSGTVTTKMLYDGADCVADYDSFDSLLRYYITPFLDENLILNNSSEDFYFTHDGIGTVRELINSSQTTVNSYDFYAFGTVNGTPTENITNRYKFTGRELDTETTSANSKPLYYYRARMYDSEIGNFCSRDPLELKNLYCYVLSNPINNIDSFGLTVKNYDDYHKGGDCNGSKFDLNITFFSQENEKYGELNNPNFGVAIIIDFQYSNELFLPPCCCDSVELLQYFEEQWFSYNSSGNNIVTVKNSGFDYLGKREPFYPNKYPDPKNKTITWTDMPGFHSDTIDGLKQSLNTEGVVGYIVSFSTCIVCLKEARVVEQMPPFDEDFCCDNQYDILCDTLGFGETLSMKGKLKCLACFNWGYSFFPWFVVPGPYPKIKFGQVFSDGVKDGLKNPTEFANELEKEGWRIVGNNCK